MARGPGRGRNADLPVALVAIAVFFVYVWVLTQAATPIVTALSTLSGNNPLAYAALLAVLVGLPGLLFTLPRALARRRVLIVPTVRSRSQIAAQRRSHLRTDVLGIAVLLLAQVPLPAPWSASGMSATIANVTMSAPIVDVSARFGIWSIGVTAVGIFAATIAKVYGHASGFRVIAIVLAVAAPVIAWVAVMRAVLP